MIYSFIKDLLGRPCGCLRTAARPHTVPTRWQELPGSVSTQTWHRGALLLLLQLALHRRQSPALSLHEPDAHLESCYLFSLLEQLSHHSAPSRGNRERRWAQGVAPPGGCKRPARGLGFPCLLAPPCTTLYHPAPEQPGPPPLPHYAGP